VLVVVGAGAALLLLPHADTTSRLLPTSNVLNKCCGFIVSISFALSVVAMTRLLLGLVEEVVGGVGHQRLVADVC
jgi:hypothetical protein